LLRQFQFTNFNTSGREENRTGSTEGVQKRTLGGSQKVSQVPVQSTSRVHTRSTSKKSKDFEKVKKKSLEAPTTSTAATKGQTTREEREITSVIDEGTEEIEEKSTERSDTSSSRTNLPADSRINPGNRMSLDSSTQPSAMEQQMKEMMLLMQTQIAEQKLRQAESDQRFMELEVRMSKAVRDEAIRARVDGSTTEGLGREQAERDSQTVSAGGAEVLVADLNRRAQELYSSSNSNSDVNGSSSAGMTFPGRQVLSTPWVPRSSSSTSLSVAPVPLAAQPIWNFTSASIAAGGANGASTVPSPMRSGTAMASLQGISSGVVKLEDFRGLAPTELVESEARKPNVLENWIYSIERALKRGGMKSAPVPDRIDFATSYFDRATFNWWTGHAMMLAARGTPVLQWEEFTKALRDYFTPIADEDTALRRLLTLGMASSESMPVYIARAAELFHRISRTRCSTEMAGEALLIGVDANRFPLALKEAKTVHNQHRARAGVGTTFEVLCSLLQEAAATEPGRSGEQPASSSHQSGNHNSSSNHHQGGKGRKGGGKPVGLSNVEYENTQEDEEEGKSQPGDLRSSALQSSKDKPSYQEHVECYKCGEKGHISRKCTSKKELRSCNNCGGKGHLRPFCTKDGGGRYSGSKNG